jgi:ATP-binding protein involved in chromosome partitioning
MFLSEAINVPVLGIIENMAYFTPESYQKTNTFLDKKVLKTCRRFRSTIPRRSPIVHLFVKQVIMVVSSMQTGSVVASVLKNYT